MAKHSWFSIDAAAAVPTLYIYEEIGAFGVTSRDFAKELSALGSLRGKKLNVRLNSPGGDVFMGNAIFNLLKDSGAEITVYIDGIAASMGSLIAMVGHKVIMAENAQMMIHNPSGFAGGDSEAMRSLATLLDSLKEGMVSAYSGKSGLSRDAVAKIMDEETWMDAKTAVSMGFADEIGGALKVAAFDLTKFKHPPHAVAQQGGLTMTKEEQEAFAGLIAGAVTAANKPMMEAITALKPATATAAAAVEGTPKTEAEIRAELKAGIKAYSDDVTALCALADHPEAAAAFIAAEKPIAEVRAALATLKAADADKRKANGGRAPAINNHANVGTDATADAEDLSDLVPKVESSAVIFGRFNGSVKKRA